MKQIFMSSVVLAAGETDRAKWLDSLKSGTVLLIPKNIYKNKMQTNKEKKYTHTKKTINKNKKTPKPPKNNKYRVYHCNKICLGNGYFLQVLRYD